MNLLNEIGVTGNLYPTHGRLSLKFTFHNPTSHPLSPTYFFPLPKDVFITGMQILTKDKTLIRAEISSITDTSLQQDGFRLIQLDSQLYSLTWQCLPAGDTCTIILECLLHFLPHKSQCRLVLPFALPTGPFQAASPCPVNLDLALNQMTPSVLSAQDSFDYETGIFSSTAQTNKDFVLDLSIHYAEPCSYLQEEFGKGCGFTRLFFPAERLEHLPNKTSILFLLDLSNTTSLRDSNALKELFFRAALSVPHDVLTQYITDQGLLSDAHTKEQLYQHLQSLFPGVGDTETLLHLAEEHQTPDTLTILVSDGAHTPPVLPDFSVVLLTTGILCPTALSHHLQGKHFHFYPKDNPEEVLPVLLQELLSPIYSVEVIPEGGNVHDCLIHPTISTLSHEYLDVAFSYSGKAPQGFSLWQNGQRILTCPLTHPKPLPRFPDAEQLYAITKIQNLTKLLEKTSPVSGRNIKNQLNQLETKFRILGTETALSLPTESGNMSAIPVRFYSSLDGISSLANRPTIFGDGVQALPQTERILLMDRCRQVIYQSIRKDGSIHSPLGIAPRMSAEETALSYLALFYD